VVEILGVGDVLVDGVRGDEFAKLGIVVAGAVVVEAGGVLLLAGEGVAAVAEAAPGVYLAKRPVGNLLQLGSRWTGNYAR